MLNTKRGALDEKEGWDMACAIVTRGFSIQPISEVVVLSRCARREEARKKCGRRRLTD